MKIMICNKFSIKELFMKRFLLVVFFILVLIGCKNNRDIIQEQKEPRQVIPAENLKWNKYLDSNKNKDVLQQIVIDQRNEVYIRGNNIIRKFDSDGIEDLDWGKRFPEIRISSFGFDRNNRLFLACWNRQDEVDGDGYNYGWLLSFDNCDGDFTKWDSKINFNEKGAGANSIAINNGVYAGGHVFYNNRPQKSDWWFSKYLLKKNQFVKTEWSFIVDGRSSHDSVVKVLVGNNNIYVIGKGRNIVSNNSGFDWWIKKFDADGKEDVIEWNKKIDAFGYDDVPTDAALDSEGNLYVVGTAVGFSQSKDILELGGRFTDWWIKKFSPDGREDKKNWNKAVYSEFNYDRVGGIVVDNDDNVYVGGSGQFNNSGGSDWWLKKYDSEGREDFKNWNITFNLGSDNDYVKSMAIDSQGYIYVGGYGRNLVGNDTGMDWCIKKFSPDGVEQ